MKGVAYKRSMDTYLEMGIFCLVVYQMHHAFIFFNAYICEYYTLLFRSFLIFSSWLVCNFLWLQYFHVLILSLHYIQVQWLNILSVVKEFHVVDRLESRKLAILKPWWWRVDLLMRKEQDNFSHNFRFRLKHVIGKVNGWERAFHHYLGRNGSQDLQ